MAKPAYAVEAWLTGEAGIGPQCSATNEFCFLCEFSEHNESGSIKDLKALIRLLVSQKKELPTIINTVQEAYRENIQRDVRCQTCTGKELVAPDWSRASISRHLVYSTEFPELFTNVVTQIYQSLIMKLNTEVVKDGSVDPEKADEIRKMTAALRKWQSR